MWEDEAGRGRGRQGRGFFHVLYRDDIKTTKYLHHIHFRHHIHNQPRSRENPNGGMVALRRVEKILRSTI